MADTIIWTDSQSTGSLANLLNYNIEKIPVAGDILLFSAAFPKPVTADADHLKSVLLAECKVQAGFNAELGTVGSPLELSADVFTYEGTGSTLHFKNGPDNDTAILIINSASGKVMVETDAGKTIDLIAVIAGKNHELLSTLTGVTEVFVGGNAMIDIQGSNAIAKLFAEPGAIITSLVPIGDIDLNGARFTQKLNGGQCTGTLKVGASGRCDWLASAAIAQGVVSTGGVIDLTQGYPEKTLTDGLVFKGGRIERGGIILNGTVRSLQVDNVDIIG